MPPMSLISEIIKIILSLILALEIKTRDELNMQIKVAHLIAVLTIYTYVYPYFLSINYIKYNSNQIYLCIVTS